MGKGETFITMMSLLIQFIILNHSLLLYTKGTELITILVVSNCLQLILRLMPFALVFMLRSELCSIYMIDTGPMHYVKVKVENTG